MHKSIHMTKKVLGLRTSEETLEKLQVIADKQNQSANQVALFAINEWLDEYNYRQKFPLIFFTKNMISKTLEILTEKQIESLSNVFAETIEELFIHIVDTPLSRTPLEKFYGLLPRLFGGSYLKWFESLEFFPNKRGDIHVLRGVHHLGLGYSKLFKNVSQIIMKKYFNLEILEESIQFVQNSIYIEFKTIKP